MDWRVSAVEASGTVPEAEPDAEVVSAFDAEPDAEVGSAFEAEPDAEESAVPEGEADEHAVSIRTEDNMRIRILFFLFMRNNDLYSALFPRDQQAKTHVRMSFSFSRNVISILYFTIGDTAGEIQLKNGKIVNFS